MLLSELINAKIINKPFIKLHVNNKVIEYDHVAGGDGYFRNSTYDMLKEFGNRIITNVGICTETTAEIILCIKGDACDVSKINKVEGMTVREAVKNNLMTCCKRVELKYDNKELILSKQTIYSTEWIGTKFIQYYELLEDFGDRVIEKLEGSNECYCVKIKLKTGVK